MSSCGVIGLSASGPVTLDPRWRRTSSVGWLQWMVLSPMVAFCTPFISMTLPSVCCRMVLSAIVTSTGQSGIVHPRLCTTGPADAPAARLNVVADQRRLYVNLRISITRLGSWPRGGR